MYTITNGEEAVTHMLMATTIIGAMIDRTMTITMAVVLNITTITTGSDTIAVTIDDHLNRVHVPSTNHTISDFFSCKFKECHDDSCLQSDLA
jgi:hypothetical protein